MCRGRRLALEVERRCGAFAGGLGLDSIDALELGVALRKTYTITIETVSEEVKAHFTSVNTLAAFIRSQQGTGR